MADNEKGDDRVSREAHERVVRERDELKAQVSELGNTVKDFAIRDKARDFFKSKNVPDPDWAADFSLPQLRDVEPDSIPEVLAGDRFKPLLTQQSAPDDPPQGETPPTDPQTGFAGGPNPGAGGTPPSPSKISRQSPEFRDAVRRNDKSQLEQWDKAGLIEWSPEVLAQEA